MRISLVAFFVQVAETNAFLMVRNWKQKPKKK